MSRQAIAAVLARTDLASGERLVALSLASFAGRENRAWPGAPAASARAGLSRSRYQQAREQLVARGLLAVDERATGRGRASTVTLVFADTGPWWDGDINVELFEAVLTLQPGSRTGAAPAGDDGGGRRRGRSGARPLDRAAVRGGRHRGQDLPPCANGAARVGLSSSSSAASAAAGTRTCGPCAIRARRGDAVSSRVAAARGAAGGRASTRRVGSRRPALRPRFTSRRQTVGEKGGQDRTLTAGNSPILTGVSGPKGGHDRTVPPEKCPVVTGVSGAKGGQDQTLFELAPIESPAQTPAKTPAETPAPNARAGREPLNPRIREDPPSPPEGGSPPDSIVVEETLRHRSRPHAPSAGPDRPRRGPSRPRDPRRRRSQRLGPDPKAAPRAGRREHVRDLARAARADRDRPERSARHRRPAGHVLVAPAAVRPRHGALRRGGIARTSVRRGAGTPGLRSGEPGALLSCPRSSHQPTGGLVMVTVGRKPEGRRRQDDDGSEHRRAVRAPRPPRPRRRHGPAVRADATARARGPVARRQPGRRARRSGGRHRRDRPRRTRRRRDPGRRRAGRRRDEPRRRARPRAVPARRARAGRRRLRRGRDRHAARTSGC